MKIRTVTVELTELDVDAMGVEAGSLDLLSAGQVLAAGAIVVDDTVEDVLYETLH